MLAPCIRERQNHLYYLAMAPVVNQLEGLGGWGLGASDSRSGFRVPLRAAGMATRKRENRRLQRRPVVHFRASPRGLFNRCGKTCGKPQRRKVGAARVLRVFRGLWRLKPASARLPGGESRDKPDRTPLSGSTPSPKDALASESSAADDRSGAACRAPTDH